MNKLVISVLLALAASTSLKPRLKVEFNTQDKNKSFTDKIEWSGVNVFDGELNQLVAEGRTNGAEVLYHEAQINLPLLDLQAVVENTLSIIKKGVISSENGFTKYSRDIVGTIMEKNAKRQAIYDAKDEWNTVDHSYKPEPEDRPGCLKPMPIPIFDQPAPVPLIYYDQDSTDSDFNTESIYNLETVLGAVPSGTEMVTPNTESLTSAIDKKPTENTTKPTYEKEVTQDPTNPSEVFKPEENKSFENDNDKHKEDEQQEKEDHISQIQVAFLYTNSKSSYTEYLG